MSEQMNPPPTTPHVDRADDACHKLTVPNEVCYLRFDEAEHVLRGSDHIGRTARGEHVIVDYDTEGHIIGIELAALWKPCGAIAKDGAL